MFVCIKSSHIERNADCSASYLISVDAIILLVNLFYKKYIVTIREISLMSDYM